MTTRCLYVRANVGIQTIVDIFKCAVPLAAGSGTVVEQLTHDTESKDSNPAAGTRREEKGKNVIFIGSKVIATIV